MILAISQVLTLIFVHAVPTVIPVRRLWFLCQGIHLCQRRPSNISARWAKRCWVSSWASLVVSAGKSLSFPCRTGYTSHDLAQKSDLTLGSAFWIASSLHSFGTQSVCQQGCSQWHLNERGLFPASPMKFTIGMSSTPETAIELQLGHQAHDCKVDNDDDGHAVTFWLNPGWTCVTAVFVDCRAHDSWCSQRNKSIYILHLHITSLFPKKGTGWADEDGWGILWYLITFVILCPMLRGNQHKSARLSLSC